MDFASISPSSLEASLEPFHLSKLPHHLAVVVLSFLFWTAVLLSSPILSTYLCPQTYPKLIGYKRTNWDVHVVSLVHSLVTCYMAYNCISDAILEEDKVFGYTKQAGDVMAVAVGYADTPPSCEMDIPLWLMGRCISLWL